MQEIYLTRASVNSTSQSQVSRCVIDLLTNPRNILLWIAVQVLGDLCVIRISIYHYGYSCHLVHLRTIYFALYKCTHYYRNAVNQCIVLYFVLTDSECRWQMLFDRWRRSTSRRSGSKLSCASFGAVRPLSRRDVSATTTFSTGPSVSGCRWWPCPLTPRPTTGRRRRGEPRTSSACSASLRETSTANRRRPSPSRQQVRLSSPSHGGLKWWGCLSLSVRLFVRLSVCCI